MKDFALRMTCPHCGGVLDFQINATGTGEPKAGDRSICYICHLFSVLESDMFGLLTLRKTTPEEQRELDNDPTVQQVMAKLFGA